MDTTIADQARLWAGMVNGDSLSAASRAEFVRPQFVVTSAHQFPTLSPATDPRGPAIGLSSGVGVMTFDDPGAGLSWHRGGHNDWTGNIAICQETRRRCVVFLGNSVRAELIYPELAHFILGENAPRGGGTTTVEVARRQTAARRGAARPHARPGGAFGARGSA